MGVLSLQSTVPGLIERVVEVIGLERQFAHAYVSPGLYVTQASANLREWVSDPAQPIIGQPLVELFWEIVGMEAEITAVLQGQVPNYTLENINRKNANGADTYFTLRLVPLDNTQPDIGLVLITENTTAFTRQAQALRQQRNELGLLRDQLDQANAKLSHLATTDSLTGLSNRRHFDKELTRHLEFAKQAHKPTTLLLLDLDNFKKFNDTFGHSAGDTQLQKLAAIMWANRRKEDVLARYGGEEFAIILPETDKTSGAAVAERLRQEIERRLTPEWADAKLPGSKETQFGTAASIGLATAPEHADTQENLIQAADNALYQAKRNGKNRVEICHQYNT